MNRPEVINVTVSAEQDGGTRVSNRGDYPFNLRLKPRRGQDPTWFRRVWEVARAGLARNNVEAIDGYFFTPHQPYREYSAVHFPNVPLGEGRHNLIIVPEGWEPADMFCQQAYVAPESDHWAVDLVFSPSYLHLISRDSSVRNVRAAFARASECAILSHCDRGEVYTDDQSLNAGEVFWLTRFRRTTAPPRERKTVTHPRKPYPS